MVILFLSKFLKCPEINILEERQKHWLIEVNDYDQNIQQFVKTLILPNNDEESMIASYRCKVKEDETRNVNNWNEHFNKLKEKHIQKNRIQITC